MFANKAPLNKYSYTVKHEIEGKGHYSYLDYSKVSYEIYKDFNITEDLKMLSTYISLQAQRVEKERKVKVLNTKIYQINLLNKKLNKIIFDSENNEVF
jgi:hypothetical protein